MQSMPVSPPPTTTTRLPSALITPSGGVGGGASLLPRPRGCAGKVVHREMHAGEFAARHLEVAVLARADRDHDRVVLLAQLVGFTSRPTSAPY